VWTETLPGLDLPVGDPLRVYGSSGNTVVVDGSTHELPDGSAGDAVGAAAARLTQLFTTPAGVVAVTESAAGDVDRVHLIVGDTVSPVGGDWRLSGSVAVALDPTGQTRIALATYDGERAEAFEGPIANPTSLGETAEPLNAVGFLDGDALFMAVDEPTRITRFHRDDETGAVSRELVGDYMLPDHIAPGAGPHFAGLVLDGDQSIALYTSHEERTCTFGYELPGAGVYRWSSCDTDSDDALTVGARYGAVGGTVHHLLVEPAFFVTKFDRSDWAQAQGGGQPHVVEAIGWESTIHVIFRVIAQGVDDPRGDPTGQASYVAVRCDVEHADCERLPHPVDLVARNISDIGRRDLG